MERGMVTRLESQAFAVVALKRSVGIPLSLCPNRMSGIRAYLPKNGQSTSLKSFGRRRRTKVLDERTRGEQTVYGEFAFWLMPRLACPTLWCDWESALVWD
jgi:hypothetical protein